MGIENTVYVSLCMFGDRLRTRDLYGSAFCCFSSCCSPNVVRLFLSQVVPVLHVVLNQFQSTDDKTCGVSNAENKSQSNNMHVSAMHLGPS